MTAKRQTEPILPPRERIIAAAADLFQRQGIRGVGVEAIAEAAGTNKMTLYRHFASKDELIAEWARGIVRRKEAEWDELAARHPNDAAGVLSEWSRRTAAKLAALEQRGSMLLNALAELPDPDHPARVVIQEHKQREHRRVLKLCREAGFQDPDLYANLFSLLIEGAHSCVQCTGMKRFGEDLVRLVDRMVANTPAPAARRG
ncbi:MAG TPA: helix-turn-helix domain-containing protein [Gemmatimonadaceae bacterium]|nr:helix-turn-helix domain-containing protein [Gemmatimonadaceae bacterium]